MQLLKQMHGSLLISFVDQTYNMTWHKMLQYFVYRTNAMVILYQYMVEAQLNPLGKYRLQRCKAIVCAVQNWYYVSGSAHSNKRLILIRISFFVFATSHPIDDDDDDDVVIESLNYMCAGHKSCTMFVCNSNGRVHYADLTLLKWNESVATHFFLLNILQGWQYLSNNKNSHF